MSSVVSNNQAQAQEKMYLSLRISKTVLATKGKNNCSSRIVVVVITAAAAMG